MISDHAENLDLKLVLRNTEHASRDARPAVEATDRLINMIGARFDAMEDRMTAVETRITAVESRMIGVERRVTASRPEWMPSPVPTTGSSRCLWTLNAG